MANDQSRLSALRTNMEVADASTPMRVSTLVNTIEVADNSAPPMRVSALGVMVEFKTGLPPLVTAGGEGPPLQVL